MWHCVVLPHCHIACPLNKIQQRKKLEQKKNTESKSKPTSINIYSTQATEFKDQKLSSWYGITINQFNVFHLLVFAFKVNKTRKLYIKFRRKEKYSRERENEKNRGLCKYKSGEWCTAHITWKSRNADSLFVHISIWCITLSKPFKNRSSAKNFASINLMACYDEWGLAKTKVDV